MATDEVAEKIARKIHDTTCEFPQDCTMPYGFDDERAARAVLPALADVWDEAVTWARGHAAERRRWHDSEGRYPPTHEADYNPYRTGGAR